MRPEPSRWPPIERLLARLKADVPVGMLERKRIELVLTAAGVPEEAEGFAAWVEQDPERLARLIAAVVGVAASHQAVVREAVAGWWALERSPRGKGGWDGWGDGDGDGGEGPSGRAGGRGSRGGGRRAWWLVAGVGVLVVAVVGWQWPWVSARLGLGGHEEGLAGESEGGVATDGATEDATDGEGGEVVEDATSTGGPDPAEIIEEEPAVPNLEHLRVRVPVASLEVVPGETSIPWAALVVVVLAAVGFVGLWRTKPPVSPLPAPPAHAPRPTRWGRVPPRGRPQRRILLERGDRDALVWGIAREASDRPTEEVDVPRSVEDTIETGIPTLWFQPASEYRGVWIWRDTTLGEHASLARRLERELEGTLRDAGLPVHVARFEGVPSMLSMGSRKLAAAALVGVGRPPRVVVLTDAVRLARRLGDDDTRERTEPLLRMLRRWEGLALVDFEGPRSELAVLARAWGLQRITPDRAAAHLAGQASRVEHPAVPRDLLRWEVACAVAPRSVEEDEAQHLRRALGLGASAFDIDALRERADGGRGQSRLEWSRRARAEIFDRFERAHGYVQEWKAGRGGARLVLRAIDHWVRVYDQAIAGRAAGDHSDTAAHLELERAMVRLWLEPDVAARELFTWWQTDALRSTVQELVSRYSDVDGEHVDAEGRAVRVRLPWALGSLEPEVQPLLVRMGLAVRQREVRVRRGGRWALGLGVAAGIGVGGVGVGVLEVMRPRVEVEYVGKAPAGAGVACLKLEDPAGSRVECEVQSRHWFGTLTKNEHGFWARAIRTNVSWALEERPCEGRTSEGGWYVRCDAAGKQERHVNGLPVWSRAVVVAADARVISQALLDTGTIDYALVVQGGLDLDLRDGDAARILQGEGQRLVIVTEEIEIEGIEDVRGSAVVVRVMDGWMPRLEFAGTRTVAEAWPEATVMHGRGTDFELRGATTPMCPAGTRYIAGGTYVGVYVEGFCLDVTEVTVAAYEMCVREGLCGDTNENEGCNWDSADQTHPINCVYRHQAATYCNIGGGRLPTDREWDWAAIGREQGRTYPWGEDAPDCEYAVMRQGGDGCGADRTWPVGKKPKGDSRDGLKDMAGNVAEWVVTERVGADSVRGGSWTSDDPGSFKVPAQEVSVWTRRVVHDPARASSEVGFRCVRVPANSRVPKPAPTPSPLPTPPVVVAVADPPDPLVVPSPASAQAESSAPSDESPVEASDHSKKTAAKSYVRLTGTPSDAAIREKLIQKIRAKCRIALQKEERFIVEFSVRSNGKVGPVLVTPFRHPAATCIKEMIQGVSFRARAHLGFSKIVIDLE